MPGSPGQQQRSEPRRTSVFVHGYSCSSEHWSAAPERLGGGIDVKLVSLPGHGGVPVPPGGRLDIDACINHVLASVAATEAHQACLIGHSLGGMVGLECVRRRPEFFVGLVLVDAFPKLGPPPPFDRSFWAGTPPDLKARTVKEMMATRRKLPSSLWESVVAFDATPHLPQLRVPVRGVYGDRGEADHGTLKARLRGTGLGRIPDACFYLVSHAGHFVMLEQPGPFYALLARILAALPGR